MKRSFLKYFLLWTAAFLAGCAESAPTVELTVPEEVAGSEFPVSVRLPAGLNSEIPAWRVDVRGRDGAKTVYAQNWLEAAIEKGGSEAAAVATFLWNPSFGGAGSYRLSFSQPEEELASTFSFAERDGKFLDLTDSGHPVLSYVFGMHLAEGVPEDRQRSSYLHPIYGPDGVLLSDDFPADHHHHRGIFWTWPQVFVEGQSFSLWDIRGIYQRFEKWLGRDSGCVFAGVGVQNGWYVGERRVVDEKVFFRVFTASDNQRIIDFILRWEATETPVTLLGSPDVKGYGGFSFRYAPFAEPVITTAGGRQTEDSNRLPFAWADLSGRFGGGSGFSGAAIFDHPGNINHANGWCLRHYGFVGIAWPGVEPYVLIPENPVTARYRVVLHRGKAEDAGLARSYQAYVKF